MSILIDRLKHGIETVKDPLYSNEHSFGEIDLDKNMCDGCGICVASCVVKAISIKDNLPLIDSKKCIYCGKCIKECKIKALTNSHNYKLADIEEAGMKLKEKIQKLYNRSLVLRSVDTGSCNACMLELSASTNTYYSLSRYGIDFAASPRHSDGIVITGPVAINMQEALIKTYYAMPEPRLVIAVGACAHDGGIFKESYGNFAPLSELLPVSLTIPGCPPSPQSIIYGLLKLIDRL